MKSALWNLVFTSYLALSPLALPVPPIQGHLPPIPENAAIIHSSEIRIPRPLHQQQRPHEPSASSSTIRDPPSDQPTTQAFDEEEDQERDLPPWFSPAMYPKPNLKKKPSVTNSRHESANREKLSVVESHMIALTRVDKYYAWKNLLDPLNEDYPTDSVYYMIRKMQKVDTDDAFEFSSLLLRTFERNLDIQKSLKIFITRLNVVSSLMTIRKPESPHFYNPKLQMLRESITSDKDWFLESFFKPELKDIELAIRDNLDFWHRFHKTLPIGVLQSALRPPMDKSFVEIKSSLLEHIPSDQEPFLSTLLQRNRDLVVKAREELTFYRFLEKFDPSKVSATLKTASVEITPEIRSLYSRFAKLLPPLETLSDLASIELNHETYLKVKEIEGDEGPEVEFKLLGEVELPDWVDAPTHLEERVDTEDNQAR